VGTVADAQLIVDAAELEQLTEEWDALAVINAEPASAPAWMVPWWRHAAPRLAELRVIAVRARGELIGIVPLYVDLGQRATSRHYRLLASDFSPSVTPLAMPDRVWDVAEATGELLASSDLRPASIELGPLPAFSPWTSALRERWPGWMRPVVHRRDLLPAPTVNLHRGSFDEWMSARSSNFRSSSRRRRRRYVEEGGSYRFATPDTVTADIKSFVDLHTARWSGLGESRLVAIGERLPDLIGDVARELIERDRFRLMLLEIDGQPICAELAIAAGGECASINLGWEERFKHLSPPMLSMLQLIEDCVARGERRLHLGWGRVDYKRSFANGDDAVAWDVLLPPGSQLPRALVGAAPEIVGRRMRESTKRVLPARQADRLRVLIGKQPRGGSA
jgi:CelD/BcsL family acetyltransferase involved in cellulose biosynthesis